MQLRIGEQKVEGILRLGVVQMLPPAARLATN